jgi:hypothetical protein
MGKEDPISFLKDKFPCKSHCINILPTSEADIKDIITLPQTRNASGYDEVTCKILKRYASLY